MFLLIHTMTITECDFVLQAQFFHTLDRSLSRVEDARLVGRRLSLRVHPHLRQGRQKSNLYRINPPTLKAVMKRNSAHIRHHVRTIHISPPVKSYSIQNEQKAEKPTVLSPESSPRSNHSSSGECKLIQDDLKPSIESLVDISNPEQTVRWLTANRFEKYIDTFSSFSGADMLRMSREDFIQICGQADGIRLYNTIHLKAIAPKLTIYVSPNNTNNPNGNSVFNAVFLSTHSLKELVNKLSALLGVSGDRVRDVYVQGPQSIHVLLNNDVISRIKDESMFTLDAIAQENGSYVLLLKPVAK